MAGHEEEVAVRKKLVDGVIARFDRYGTMVIEERKETRKEMEGPQLGPGGGRAFACSFDKIRGYAGETPGELKLFEGKKVRFALEADEDEKVARVELI